LKPENGNSYKNLRRKCTPPDLPL